MACGILHRCHVQVVAEQLASVPRQSFWYCVFGYRLCCAEPHGVDLSPSACSSCLMSGLWWFTMQLERRCQAHSPCCYTTHQAPLKSMSRSAYLVGIGMFGVYWRPYDPPVYTYQEAVQHVTTCVNVSLRPSSRLRPRMCLLLICWAPKAEEHQTIPGDVSVHQ